MLSYNSFIVCCLAAASQLPSCLLQGDAPGKRDSHAKDFVLCGPRPKALLLETASLFKGLSETLNFFGQL